LTSNALICEKKAKLRDFIITSWFPVLFASITHLWWQR
jgi:hypothetical protein